MNHLKNKWTALTAAALLSIAATAHAGVYTGELTVSRQGGPGSEWGNLGSQGEFCFLTRVDIRDIDGNSEGAACNLIRGTSNWTLYATVFGSANTSARVDCRATCYTTN
jgi:hypothetical protein